MWRQRFWLRRPSRCSRIAAKISKLFSSVHEAKAKDLFYTNTRIFQAASSGSGMQEAGIRNFVQESVLSCINGSFAQRWYDVAVANGKQADKLEVEMGEAITPELLRDALKKKHYEAVTIVHNETSTGVENPMADLCKVVPGEPARIHSSWWMQYPHLAGVKIELDALGIGFLLTSSQKCLALPPGLSLASASDRAMKKAESVTNRGWYFDLLLMEKHRLKDSTPMTPAMALIYALDVQLDRIFAEGLEEPLCPPCCHVQAGAGLGRHKRYGTGCQSGLPLQDRGDHAQQSQLGHQRAQQVPADQGHAYCQWLWQAQRHQLPYCHHGRNQYGRCGKTPGCHG